MNASSWPHHLSAFRIDRYLLGELASGDAADVRAHLSSCAGCAQAADSQRPADNLPPLRAAPRRKAWTAAAGASLLAAAASFALVARPAGVRVKGSAPGLSVYVQHEGTVQPVGQGGTVHAGDAIRFAASSTSPAWLAVLSVDPRGAASVYFPLGERAEAIPQGADVPLPLATRLDETLGEERIVALFCNQPVVLLPLRESLAQGRLLVPEGCEVVRWSFVKR